MQDPAKFDEVYLFGSRYVQPAGERQGRIHLTWSMWGGPQGHAKEGRGCFFASFDPFDDRMYSVDGTDLGTCLDYDQIIGKCLIETAEPTGAYSHTVLGPASSLDGYTGLPVVAYGFKDHHCPQGIVRVAIWSEAEQRWNIQTLDSNTCEFRDIEVDPQDGRLRIALLSGQDISIRESHDGGMTWAKECRTPLSYDNGADHVPYMNFIENHRPEAQLLLGQMNGVEAYTDYSGKWSIYTIGKDLTDS